MTSGISYRNMYENCPCGKGHGGFDDKRNYPLFVQMAEEWGFSHELPCYLPCYIECCPIVDHVRKYHTMNHGDVFVFSPYLDGHELEEDAYKRMMAHILKLNPSLIGVYTPKYSYYNEHTFTFVLKGCRRTKRYNPNLFE